MAAPTSFLYELIGLFGHPVAENPRSTCMRRPSKPLGLQWRYIDHGRPG